MSRVNAKKGIDASVEGFANEYIVIGILMRKYKNVSLVDLPLSKYDLIIVFKDKNEDETIIKAQIKTAKKSVSFTGGVRGGVDREYKSGIKEYIQSTKTSDVVIGVTPIGDNNFDLYFVPTILVEHFGTKSKSIKKLAALKNNYEFLEKCKDRSFILQRAKQLNIIN